MAGEASGHYMFSEVGGYEMPLLALYYVLLELEENSNFDEMIDNFEKYHKTPIQSIKVKDKDLVLNKIKKYYSDYKQDYLD
jgi:phosphomannomutase